MMRFVSKEEPMKDLRMLVLGMTLTIVLAGVPNLYPVVMKEPKDNTKVKVQTGRDPSQDQRRLEREVRHELVTLPYYDVFDNLEYRVDGSQVILSGQVVRPTLKSGAENVVKNIEGVERVTNNIEVLPLSPNDDRLRIAVYRAIYGQTALQRYSMRSVPPIHIIVRNGNVALEGVVANEGDKNIANIQANGVSGVFSVKNTLRVEQ
jgi:osmotically-inducible protein OsmY